MSPLGCFADGQLKHWATSFSCSELSYVVLFVTSYVLVTDLELPLVAATVFFLFFFGWNSSYMYWVIA
jgi:hypothetical protein